MKRGSIRISDTKLAEQWDVSRNMESPRDVPICSNKKRWWRCAAGHSWETSPNNRHKGRGCPYCSGNKTSEEKSLLVLEPELAREWGKRNKFGPELVRMKSNLRVWWKCGICGHEWRTSVANRTDKGSGCPECKRLCGSSALEMRVFAELQCVFPDATSRARIGGVECDVFVPSLGLAVEVDGKRWHGDVDRDRKKNDRVEGQGVHLVRVRECGLPMVGKNDVVYRKGHLWEAVADLMGVVGKIGGVDLEWYRKGGMFVGDEAYAFLMVSKGVPKGRLLFECRPEFRKEWDYVLNVDNPEKLTAWSNIMVWWKCEKGHGWRACVSTRTRGNGCPYCANKRVDASNCLLTKNPELSKEWDERRTGFGPKMLTPGSGKMVWWRCGRGHSWRESVRNRSGGYGCPYCSGHRKWESGTSRLGGSISSPRI